MADPGAAENVQLALELLGPNGEHWIQGQLRDGLGDFCVVGALIAAAPDYDTYARARDALKDTLQTRRLTGSGNIDRWNNRSSWPDVQSVLTQTVQRLAL